MPAERKVRMPITTRTEMRIQGNITLENMKDFVEACEKMGYRANQTVRVISSSDQRQATTHVLEIGS